MKVTIPTTKAKEIASDSYGRICYENDSNCEDCGVPIPHEFTKCRQCSELPHD